MHSGDRAIRKFNESVDITLYHPPWSLDDLIMAATEVYGLPPDRAPEVILKSWKTFGGVPYSVLDPDFFDKPRGRNDSISVELALWRGYKEINPKTTSGTLLHLIPSPDYTTYRTQWSSTEPMLHTFRKMFRVTKNEIITLDLRLEPREYLFLQAMYGHLFEPWFHTVVTQHGHVGRLRKLEKADDGGGSAPPAQRNFLGKIKTTKHKIRPLPLNCYYLHSEIHPDEYNIPVERHHPAIHALCPKRGKMFHITSADNPGINAEHLIPL
jgi:hypothetical protein